MTAEHRNLRSGHTLWEADLPGPVGGPLTRDIHCDVLIVGGGISGALLAEAFSTKNLSIALIERRGIARGSTAASTALVEWEIDTPLIELTEQIGETAAQRAWLRSARSIQDLATTIKSLGIDCDYRARESLYLCGDKLDAAELVEEAAARQQIGLPSRFLDAAALKTEFGIARNGAILSRDAAELNPVKLTAGLMHAAAKRGVKIFEPEEAADLEKENGRMLVSTKSGRRITTKYLVYATGYELPDIVPRGGYRVISTWALASRPQAGKLWPRDVLISESSDPYLYVRSTPDRRIVAGGEDEIVEDAETRKKLLEEKTKAIEKKLKKLLPWLDPAADYAWTGAFGASDTGLPLIGRVPGWPQCFAVLGFGGNGTTYSAIAAQVIAAEISEETDPDAELFAFKEPSTFGRMRAFVSRVTQDYLGRAAT